MLNKYLNKLETVENFISKHVYYGVPLIYTICTIHTLETNLLFPTFFNNRYKAELTVTELASCEYTTAVKLHLGDRPKIS